MKKIKSCYLQEYYPKKIFIIDKDLFCIIKNDDDLLFYDIKKSEITNKFTNFKDKIIYSHYNNYLLSSDYYNHISIYDLLNNKVIEEFPMLRDFATMAIMNHKYVIIKDSGYVGCRLFEEQNGQYIKKNHLKLAVKSIVNIKLKDDILYSISLDGYLLIKSLKPNYSLKKIKIADKLLYGLDVDDKYIYIVTLDKKIVVLDKLNLSNKKIFQVHDSFVQSVVSHKDFVYSADNFLPLKTKEVIIWNPDDLTVRSKINCSKNIISFIIKEELLYILDKEIGVLDIYQHENFKKSELWEL